MNEGSRRAIARRKFEVLKPGKLRGAVTITICSPAKVAPNEWECAFRIVGLGEKLHGAEAARIAPLTGGWGRAHGVDSVQALFLALVAARRYLRNLVKPGFRIRWNGIEDDGLPDGRAEFQRSLHALSARRKDKRKTPGTTRR